MPEFKSVFAVCLLTALVAVDASNAEEITQAELDPSNTTIDFESFGLGLQSNPLAISGATFSSSMFLRINDVSPFDADDNHPLLTIGNVLTTVDNPNFPGSHVPITIVFDPPVSQVGLGWWDPNSPGNRLEVYDENDVLLEQVTPLLWPVGGANASFVGIRRPTQEIAYAIVVNASGGDIYAIDNFSFGAPAAVPLSSFPARALLILVLLVIGSAVGRRWTSAVA